MYSFAALDHNNSVHPIVNALLGLGYKWNQDAPDFILLDHDSPKFYREIIDNHPQAKVIIYPHGEPFAFWWDGMWEVNERTAGYLAQSKGHGAVMRKYGYSKPVHTIDWYLSEQSEFKPAAKLDRVLFAPIHPLNNGFIHPSHRAANIEAYKALLGMPINLTVRYLGNLENNGLWADDSVTFIEGSKDGSTTPTDLVVSNLGTYFALSVASGIPCVAYNQDLPPVGGHSEETTLEAQNWKSYKEFVRYPYDLLNARFSALGVLDYATRHEAKKWRDRFIGEPLNADKLNKAIQTIMKG